MRRTALAALAAAPLLAAFSASAQTPAPPAPTASAPDSWIGKGTAELTVLDKQRAQPGALQVRTGQQATFGTLTIAVKSCVTRPPDQPQNDAAFLEVTDSRNSAPVFRGWVFSRTPAVSQLEHPVYDLRLAACR